MPQRQGGTWGISHAERETLLTTAGGATPTGRRTASG